MCMVLDVGGFFVGDYQGFDYVGDGFVWLYVVINFGCFINCMDVFVVQLVDGVYYDGFGCWDDNEWSRAPRQLLLEY